MDVSQTSLQGVRDDTAELASYALSDAISTRSLSPSYQFGSAASNASHLNNGSYFGGRLDRCHITRLESHETSRPGVIHEVSEPGSPAVVGSPRKSPPVSALSEMIRNSPPLEDEVSMETEESNTGVVDTRVATIAQGIICQPSEMTPLLSGQAGRIRRESTAYNSIKDLERQGEILEPVANGIRSARVQMKGQGNPNWTWISNPRTWNKRMIWTYGVHQPVSYVPAIVLGLLLNILDALSYGENMKSATFLMKIADRATGMILFPLGIPIFQNLGPDGIAIFYVSCIVSQLVYSLGGSMFRGGVGSEMVRIMPCLRFGPY